MPRELSERRCPACAATIGLRRAGAAGIVWLEATCLCPACGCLWTEIHDGAAWHVLRPPVAVEVRERVLSQAERWELAD